MSTTTDSAAATTELATFAGGCFWCMESAFDHVPGVTAVVSGYTGGSEHNPTYEQVSSGRTGHVEAVQVTFDTRQLRYNDLLWMFWRQIDPTDAGGQFADRGAQYTTAIFAHGAEQERRAIASKNQLAASGRFSAPIVTAIGQAGTFYPAEDYHQDYFRTNPVRYGAYRSGSGRDQYLTRVWGDEPHGPHAFDERQSQQEQYTRPTDEQIRGQLTPIQYRVTQQDGTEPAFDNAFWDNHQAGLYVDIVSGEPLFSSTDKYDSGSGWPSFTRPLVAENIVERQDGSHLMVRTEVRSRIGDSHLGHLFPDGPPPTGRRYCINSAALRFIPAPELDEAGYGAFSHLFGG